MRRLRLALAVWLEVELSAAILVLPLAVGDLSGLIVWRIVGREAVPILAALLLGIATTLPLAIWGRPVAKGFRGWR